LPYFDVEDLLFYVNVYQKLVEGCEARDRIDRVTLEKLIDYHEERMDMWW
jgi:hypothetical protein